MLLATLALLVATATPAPPPVIDTTPTPAPSAAPTPAGSPPPDAVSKAITAQYALSCAAVLSPTAANLQAMFATIAPEFTNTDTTGAVMQRDKYVDQAQKQFPALHSTDCSNTFAYMVETDANTVVVMNEASVKGNVASPDGKHDLDYSGKSRDTWKLENGKWLEAQSTDVHVTVKVDGNVMQDSGT